MDGLELGQHGRRVVEVRDVHERALLELRRDLHELVVEPRDVHVELLRHLGQPLVLVRVRRLGLLVVLHLVAPQLVELHEVLGRDLSLVVGQRRT